MILLVEQRGKTKNMHEQQQQKSNEMARARLVAKT